MSRYVIKEHAALWAGNEIVVGWDDPLGTFFVHVYSPDGELSVGYGLDGDPIVTLKDVEEIVTKAGGNLDMETVAKLCEDYAAHAEWKPGPLQEALGFTGRH